MFRLLHAQISLKKLKLRIIHTAVQNHQRTLFSLSKAKGFCMRLVVGIFYLLSLSLMAQSNNKGPNSPVVVAKIISFQDNTLSVDQAGSTRKLTLSEKSKVRYVSFQDIKQEFKPGYFIKARVKDNVINTIYVTLPIVDIANGATKEMVKMSAKQLFDLTDTDNNKMISYLELSAKIYYSPKHGPDGFYNLDSDSSGNLDLSEFTRKIGKVVWYRYSRKSPEQWMAALDNDKNNSLSAKEFSSLVGKGHLDSLFKRADQDKSKSIELKELSEYLNKEIFRKPRR